MKTDFITIAASILDRYGDREYNGMGLSVLEHMLQSATESQVKYIKWHKE